MNTILDNPPMPGMAHLEQTASGELRYFCTCHPREDGWSLAEVYAAQETGTLKRLTGTDLALWQARLLTAAGVR